MKCEACKNIFLRDKLNKFKNTGARLLGSIYDHKTTFKSRLNFFDVAI